MTTTASRFDFTPPEDDMVDAEYTLKDCPRFAVQVFAHGGRTTYHVNEYGGEGDDFWMKDHGGFNRKGGAMLYAIFLAETVDA